MNSQHEDQSIFPKIKKNSNSKKKENSIKSNPGLMQFEMDHSKDIEDLGESDSVIKKKSKEIRLQMKLIKKDIKTTMYPEQEKLECPPETFESNNTKHPTRKRQMTITHNLGKGISQADVSGVEHFNQVKRKQLGGLSLDEFKKQRNDSLNGDSLINHQRLIKDLKKIQKTKIILESSDSGQDDVSDDDNLQAAFNVQEFNPAAKNQSDNKRVFLNNYGVEQEIPAVYILDGKVYPKIQIYTIQVVKYIVPKNNQKYRTFDFGKMPVDQLSEQLYQDAIYDPNCVILQLIKRVDGQLEVLKTLPLPNAILVNINFSSDGMYLSIFRKRNNNLQIYTIENEDISGLFGKILKNEYLYQLDGRDEFKNAQKMVFDMKNKYLICHGDHVVNIIALDQASNHGIVKEIEVISKAINMMEYKKILDLNFDSQSNQAFRCEVACQSLRNNYISIFDINDESPNILRRIYYNNDKLHRLRVKISEDFMRVVLTSIHESYLLTFDSKMGYQQKNIIILQHKGVGFILSQKSEFLFVCYKEYDKNIDLLSTISESFKLSSPMGIEPHFFSILDVVQEGMNELGLGTKLTVCSKNGQTFCLDVLKPQDHWNSILGKSILNLKPIQDDFTSKLTIGSTKSLFGQQNTVSEQYSMNVFRCYQTRWPYVVSTGFDGYLWLYNAFTTIISRIMVPNFQGLQICSIYISDNDNLYFMLHSSTSQIYQLWMIDLCNKNGVYDYDSQDYELQKCFEYTSNDVQNKELLDIMVRCESRQDESLQNKRQFVVILHQGAIYYWWNGQNQINLLDNCFSKKIMKTAQNEFLYVGGDIMDKEQIFQIKLVKIKFSTFNKKTIYEKANTQTISIKYFAIDSESMKLILLLNQKNLGVNKKIMSIIDLKENNTLISLFIQDKEIIGRFKSGLFSLIDGHFYSGNKVFKIRYDLLNQSSTKTLTEVQLFDKYNDLINLKMGEVINSGNPLTCKYYHRIVYISRNFKFLQPSRIMILPFLHERKVYVNRTNDRDMYFYNVVDEDVHFHKHQDQCTQGSKQTMIIAINLTDFDYSYYSEKGIFICKVNFQQCVKDFGLPIQVSNNGIIFVFQKPDNIFKLHLISFTTLGPIYMKTINVGEDIFQYVISLREHCKDEQELEKVKEIQNKFKYQFNQYLTEENMMINIDVNNNLDVVIEISSKQEHEIRKELQNIFSMRDIDILQRISKLEIVRDNSYERSFLRMKQEDIQESLNKLYPLLSEECTRILSLNGEDFKKQIKQLMTNSSGQVYYIQKGSVGLQHMYISEKQKSFIQVDNEALDVNLQQLIFANDFRQFFNNDSRPGLFTINEDIVLFWNDNQVFYLQLDDTKVNELTSMKQINLNLDPEYNETFIRHVRAGSKASLISIVVRQSLHQDCVIIWDLLNDIELNSFDTGIDPRLFFDQQGKTYYTEKDQVVFCDTGVTLSAYDVTKVNSSNRKDSYFQYYKGHRFDSKNHNWILFNEYISLSFSFMTFVIRDRDQNAVDDIFEQNFLFDKEQFNFIINKRTCFTCDDFVATDYEKLQTVLNELKLLDPILLEQLYYFYYEDPIQLKQLSNKKSQRLNQSQSLNKKIAVEPSESSLIQTDGEYVKYMEKQKKITPLHLAHREGNNRSINILLKFMSYVKIRNTEAIQDILPDFVDYQQFIPYMNSLPFQTIQMKNKQTLKMKGVQTSSIVAVSRSNTSYIENVYYKNQMGECLENKSYNNYPVRVSAFKVDWIINSSQGNKFLQAILNSERLEVFESQTIISLIQFLFKHFRQYILMQRLPPYILQLINYYAATFINVQFEQYVLDGTCSAANKFADCRTLANIQEITAFLNIISTFYAINIVFKSLRASGLQYLKSIWAWSDISYIFLNSFINASLILEDLVDKKTTRVIQSLLSIIIIIKLLYFMQLIDEIAPLVSIILLIFIEIGWFIVIFILIVSGFTVSFYLIGKNQIDFITEMEDGDPFKVDGPGYTTIVGSFKHVYLLALGEFNLDDYTIGNDYFTTSLLWLLFILATFILLIHLLNMLIAIMGETFTDNNQVKHMQQHKSRLNFVLDNLYIDPIRKKKKIKYIVTAKIFEDEDEDNIISEIKETLDRFVINQSKHSQGIYNQLNKVVQQNEQIYNGLK